jgi:Clathrin adaptor complex small chain
LISKTISKYILTLTDVDCNFIKIPEFDNLTIVFRKFASLFFVCLVDEYESQFAIIDLIRIIVDLLDEVFKNCREIDIKYNPEKVRGMHKIHIY